MDSRRNPSVLVESARQGDRAAVGRLLSLVEQGGEPGREVGRLTFGPSGTVDQVVGVTGSPGAGKSTLTNRLIGAARAEGRKVAVVAVDPTSPFSGGAILGDRIRMQDHALDDGVFVRSMATRGHLGGLALATPEAVRVLVASGMPLVLVETVGVGQVEVEIAGSADTTVVVVNPGWGDAVQAAKAGLLEVADVFAINKADRPGAEETARDLNNMLDLGSADAGWRPPIVSTVATADEGTAELWSAVRSHREYLSDSGLLERRRNQRLLDELRRVLTSRIERAVRSGESGAAYEDVRRALLDRQMDPYEAAEKLLGTVGLSGP
jgi:LAO/AO transport system kinase